MRTQVGIIGAGPAGLLLARLLHLQGVASTVLECRDRASVEAGARPGVLEHGTAQTLREAGAGARMDSDAMVHDGIELRFAGRGHRIDLAALTGRRITVYGQQDVVRDLLGAQLTAGGDVRFEVDVIGLSDLDTDRPRVSFVENGRAGRLDCDFVVGADGAGGISRGYLPAPTVTVREHPYSWLGVLARTPPSSPELIYARHRNGFALHLVWSPRLTRLYLQVATDDHLVNWPDDRVWDELHTRLSGDDGMAVLAGPVLHKAITPMRSAVTAPMQYGRLHLAGDAAHLVAPTGAKGLNLAVADARLLARAIAAYYIDGRLDLLGGYTDTALRRVRQAAHFSWWMTSMLHRDPAADDVADRLATAQLEYVTTSAAMAASLAENYTGPPYPEDWSYR
jgi:p-hydroxybenzoate 3-monooxygenase